MSQRWLTRLGNLAPPISGKIAHSEYFSKIVMHLAGEKQQKTLVEYIGLFVTLANSGEDDVEQIRKDMEQRKADAKTLRAAMRIAARRRAESLIGSGRDRTTKELHAVLRHTARLVENGGYPADVRADMRKQTKKGDYFRAFTIRQAGRILRGMDDRAKIIAAHMEAAGLKDKNLLRNARALLKRDSA